jgi:hypothetical protein
MVAMNQAQALVVGIAAYQQIRPLPAAVRSDAEAIRAVLVDPLLCGYPPENVQVLLDGAATLAGLRSALANLAERSTATGTVLIYVSCHGGRIEAGAAAGPESSEYLLPVDVGYDGLADNIVASTALSGAELTRLLRSIPARRLVVVFDCCHAGGIGEPKAGAASGFKAGLPEGYYDQLKTGRGRVILASSRSTELSWILPGASHSLFTQHVVAGLRGGANGAGGVIRIFDLFDYVQPRVTADEAQQHPMFKAELEENFAIALYQGGKSSVPPEPSPMPLPDGFEYDVFVSYRQRAPDKGWVRKVLVPQLEALGLRVCVDYRDFRLGAVLIKEMERAVVTSRYTLAVLSPQYLQSNFTEFENLIAEHLGLEAGARRLLLVMREDCQPRLSLRSRLWLDMTDDEEFAENVARLGQELRL